MTQKNLLAHAEHSINLGDSEPVEDVRHQSLEPHVFDASDVLGPFEVVRRTIFSSFPCIVHDCPLSDTLDIMTKKG